MKELTLVTVQSQLTKQQKLMVNEETLADINKLARDDSYGEEFLESYLDHLNVLAEAPRNTHAQYLNAVKFFSLVEAGNSLTDAYIKVFPERFEAAKRGNPQGDKELIRGNASRYNSSKMVNEIRRVATMPVQLIHRHLLHEAILETASLMTTAKSEMVRQKAADTLIRELKPAEDAVIKIDVNDGSKSIIEELRSAAQTLAAKQHEAVLAGTPLKEITQAKIYTQEEDDILDTKAE
ncbi:MAG: hypothetical protein V3S69_00845 [Dehalococcoidales bacterium]